MSVACAILYREDGTPLHANPYRSPQPQHTGRLPHRQRTPLNLLLVYVSAIIAMLTGWWLGDREGVLLLNSTWSGPLPITSSPGFTILLLLLLMQAACAAIHVAQLSTAALVCAVVLSLMEGVLVYGMFFGASIANP